MIQKLEKGLSAWLSYHNAGHTMGVIEAAEHLAVSENISGDDLILVKTTALFHDAGYMQLYKGHEEISCEIAKEHLPEFGYSSVQIDTVCRLIMATRIPQEPADILGQILCNADLYYIGTDEYSFYAGKLFQELESAGMVKTKRDWILRQVEFLTNHRFFTPSAIRER